MWANVSTLWTYGLFLSKFLAAKYLGESACTGTAQAQRLDRRWTEEQLKGRARVLQRNFRRLCLVLACPTAAGLNVGLCPREQMYADVLMKKLLID